MTKDPPSRVRARALVHMQRILATSAAAVAVGDAGCHPKDKSATDAGTFGPPAVDASTTVPPVADLDVLPQVADAGNVVVSERNHGYAVVDPMPRPAHCPDLAGHFKATATKAGDKVTVKVDNAGGRSGFKFTKGQPPVVYGGTLVSHTVEASNASVTITAASKDGSSVSLKGTCTKGGITVTVSVLSDLTTYVSEY